MKDAILSVLRRKKDVPAGKIVSSGPKPLSIEADVLIKLKTSMKEKEKAILSRQNDSLLPSKKIGSMRNRKRKTKKKKRIIISKMIQGCFHSIIVCSF